MAPCVERKKGAGKKINEIDGGGETVGIGKKKNLLVYCVCLLLTAALAVGIMPALAMADSLNPNQWYWRNPLPTNNSLAGICYGNAQFVAVGANGTILTSPDGKVWTGQSPGTTTILPE